MSKEVKRNESIMALKSYIKLSDMHENMETAQCHPRIPPEWEELPLKSWTVGLDKLRNQKDKQIKPNE